MSICKVLVILVLEYDVSRLYVLVLLFEGCDAGICPTMIVSVCISEGAVQLGGL